MSQRSGKSRQDWNTPRHVADLLHAFAPISLDPCSNRGSVVRADRAVELPEDGLEVDWSGERHVFVNPPYSEQRPWAEKAADAADQGATVTMLIPASPETRLWREVVWARATAVAFWGRRINFTGSKNTLPSALVLWGGDCTRFVETFRAEAVVVTEWSPERTKATPS